MPQPQRLSSVIPFVAIERPTCPRCKAPMMLVSIELSRLGVDLHTFECAICNRVLKTLAADEDPMKSKGLGRWLQGDLHPVANAEACLVWLDRGTPDLAAARCSVEWIIDDGNRASEVIRRVRALANKTDIERVPLDVNDIVREVIALVQRELISHRASLRTELAPALPMILGDRVQLQQVIINLVMNGIEAMQAVTDRPRELLIRSGQNETRQAIVSVTDCGVGISAENADRLFNPSFTTKSGGMGMELSICRSITEANGGRLSASGNEGPGGTFQFVLPLHQEDAS
jgi:signal transduction histidine kinase